MTQHIFECLIGVILTLGMASTMVIYTIVNFGAEIKNWNKN